MIAGSNFTGATSVTFDGTPALSFAAKATSIKAIAPAGSAGTVDVVVTTPGGVSAITPADHYTYLLPAISSVTPTSGPGAGGKAVVISGADFNGTTAVDFGGTPATSIIVKPTAIKAVVPPGLAGTVYVLGDHACRHECTQSRRPVHVSGAVRHIGEPGLGPGGRAAPR